MQSTKEETIPIQGCDGDGEDLDEVLEVVVEVEMEEGIDEGFLFCKVKKRKRK